MNTNLEKFTVEFKCDIKGLRVFNSAPTVLPMANIEG